MKVIVTGHQGYIGPLLVRLLLERGHQVKGIDTNYFDRSCELYPLGQDIEEVAKDIRDVTEEDLKGYEAVCHLAALSNDPLGQFKPELTLDVNFKASVKLCEASRRAGVRRFLYSSSCSMYGVAGEEALTEEAPLNPVTAYARSKVLSEEALLKLNGKDFSVTTLRNATAYGISSKMRVDLVLNNLVGWAVTTGKIKIMSDGTPRRPLIHAQDIARAFVAALEAPAPVVSGQAFNVGMNSENYQVKEIAAMIQERVPRCEIIFTGEHGADSRTYTVDFNKISRLLPGFRPQWTVRQGIDQLLEMYGKYGLSTERFEGRYFIRLKQLQYLIESQQINGADLYWCKEGAHANTEQNHKGKHHGRPERS